MFGEKGLAHRFIGYGNNLDSGNPKQIMAAYDCSCPSKGAESVAKTILAER